MTLTYHNDPNVKAVRIERCKAHMEADRLRAGTYGEIDDDGEFAACAIGCQVYDIAQEHGVHWRAIGDNRHAVVAEDYGWPEWLCWLEDTIFEGLPSEQQAGWPLRLVEAVPVGRDISAVRHRFLSFVAREIVKFDRERFPDVAAVNDRVAALHDRAAAGDPPTEQEWSAAISAARSAAWSVEWSAAWSVEWSAARSVERSAGISAAYVRMADKLIELLEAA